MIAIKIVPIMKSVTSPNLKNPTQQLALDITLRDDATFANYVGEAKTRLAHPGQLVYLWGQIGRAHV